MNAKSGVKYRYEVDEVHRLTRIQLAWRKGKSSATIYLNGDWELSKK